MRAPYSSAAAAALVATALVGCDSPEPRARPEITTGDITEAVVTGTKYYQASGKAPVFLVRAGRATFAGEVKEEDRRRIAGEVDRSLWSDDVARAEGEITITALDRVDEDEAIAKSDAPDEEKDEANVSGWFRGDDGARYEFELLRVMPAEREGPDRSHFGGVASDKVLGGDSKFGSPLMPKLKANVAVWGMCRLERNGQLLGELPCEVLVTSRTRDPETGKPYRSYDASMNEIGEVHLLLHPAGHAAAQPDLASGFHVVWGNADVSFRPF